MMIKLDPSLWLSGATPILSHKCY